MYASTTQKQNKWDDDGTVAEGKPLMVNEYNNANDDYVAGIPLYQGDSVPVDASRFVVTGYRDVWAALLFVLAVVCSAGLAAYNAKDLRNADTDSDDQRVLHHLKIWAPVSALISAFAGMTMISLMSAFAKGFIVGSNIFVIVLDAGIAGYAFYKQFIWMGVLLALCAALHALWFYLVRNRIPFATVLLHTSSRLAMRFKGTMVVSLVALIAGAVYLGVWILMVHPVAKNFDRDHQNVSTWNFPAALGLLLLLLWVSQVCANVTHVTSSGVVATWYFCGEENVPPNPTLASAQRAMTTSFGSICFGSLLVAIVKLIYYLAKFAERSNRNDFFLCMMRCIIGILERLFEWFNVYAFTHIAIYGSSYIEAAKQTWEMVKNCGWAAYFNDCLVWPVLSLVCFFTSAAVGCAIGLGTWNVLVGVICFCVAYVVMIIMIRPVYSGIATQFVCVAECPDVMQRTNLQYFQAIEAATNAMFESTC